MRPAARLWTALLLPAGVFTLHGVQCAAASSADSTGASHIASAVTTAHVIAAPTTALTGRHAEGLLPDPATGAGIAAAAAAAVDTDHGSAPHDTPRHLWTVCLAVLAAGLAVLLAVLMPRLARLSRPALARARVPVAGGPATPRPPDLSALCLLRI